MQCLPINGSHISCITSSGKRNYKAKILFTRLKNPKQTKNHNQPRKQNKTPNQQQWTQIKPKPKLPRHQEKIATLSTPSTFFPDLSKCRNFGDINILSILQHSMSKGNATIFVLWSILAVLTPCLLFSWQRKKERCFFYCKVLEA